MVITVALTFSIIMSSVLKAPFTCIVAGPSGCGKTELTLRFVENIHSMVHPMPARVVWCFGIYQKKFDSFRKFVEFHEGLPSTIDSIKPNTLLIIDDLMAEAGDQVMSIFTKGSHHKNISCFFLTQNLYFAGKHNRTMNLNCHYMFLFKNPRDQTQIQVLSRQMFPQAAKYLEEAFRDATSTGGQREKFYSYLFVDLKSDTEDHLRLRTRIFPDDFPNHFVYVPNNSHNLVNGSMSFY